MTKKILSGALALLMLTAAPAAFAQAVTVKDVEVTADLTAVQNPEAAKFWANVADDLKNAIVARLTDRIKDDGRYVSVDIDEVSLTNAFQDAVGSGKNKLSGKVKIFSKPSNATDKVFDLDVSMDNAVAFLPQGYDIAKLTTNSAEYYGAMIAAFADAVVADVK